MKEVWIPQSLRPQLEVYLVGTIGPSAFLGDDVMKRWALSLDSSDVEEELLVASPPSEEAKLALGLSEVQVQIFDLFGSEPIPLIDEGAGEPR